MLNETEIKVLKKVLGSNSKLIDELDERLKKVEKHSALNSKHDLDFWSKPLSVVTNTNNDNKDKHDSIEVTPLLLLAYCGRLTHVLARLLQQNHLLQKRKGVESERGKGIDTSSLSNYDLSIAYTFALAQKDHVWAAFIAKQYLTDNDQQIMPHSELKVLLEGFLTKEEQASADTMLDAEKNKKILEWYYFICLPCSVIAGLLTSLPVYFTGVLALSLGSLATGGAGILIAVLIGLITSLLVHWYLNHSISNFLDRHTAIQNRTISGRELRFKFFLKNIGLKKTNDSTESLSNENGPLSLDPLPMVFGLPEPTVPSLAAFVITVLVACSVLSPSFLFVLLPILLFISFPVLLGKLYLLPDTSNKTIIHIGIFSGVAFSLLLMSPIMLSSGMAPYVVFFVLLSITLFLLLARDDKPFIPSENAAGVTLDLKLSLMDAIIIYQTNFTSLSEYKKNLYNVIKQLTDEIDDGVFIPLPVIGNQQSQNLSKQLNEEMGTTQKYFETLVTDIYDRISDIEKDQGQPLLLSNDQKHWTFEPNHSFYTDECPSLFGRKMPLDMSQTKSIEIRVTPTEINYLIGKLNISKKPHTDLTQIPTDLVQRHSFLKKTVEEIEAKVLELNERAGNTQSLLDQDPSIQTANNP